MVSRGKSWTHGWCSTSMSIDSMVSVVKLCTTGEKSDWCFAKAPHKSSRPNRPWARWHRALGQRSQCWDTSWKNEGRGAFNSTLRTKYQDVNNPTSGCKHQTPEVRFDLWEVSYVLCTYVYAYVCMYIYIYITKVSSYNEDTPMYLQLNRIEQGYMLMRQSTVYKFTSHCWLYYTAH